jgi:hypothetical protein
MFLKHKVIICLINFIFLSSTSLIFRIKNFSDEWAIIFLNL